ncbi:MULTISPECIES: hypothetical protein [unclassified Thalassospira]|uniref:hypothetical protein n=1 Tax=unclassified Thalassospira TaxID=2648997 RepID=UPI0007A5E40D|nr:MULTISPECIES: hypothetical protein [unclassified Thalassospira]KZD01139.1 hypothetical protein AUQ41_20360 [Thalassospira sp. MCCC 1A02898]ONH85290.1 hypothetical protein TH47_06225 [Thalassospira sp. MCCC 1A02803]
MPLLDSKKYETALANAQNESSVINEWRALANIDSFAYKLLNTGITDITSLMPKVDYHNYSGVVRGEDKNFLGKFFHLARFVDGDSTNKRKAFFSEAYLNLDGKPITAGPFGKTAAQYDEKPWSKSWDSVSPHIKGYIEGRWRSTSSLNRSITQNINDPIFSKKTKKPDDLSQIPGWYADAPPTSNETGAFSRLDLFKCIAGAGSVSPIVQPQIGGELYIRGYLMNQLVVESPSGTAAEYYGKAIGDKLGLLSGPSGTSKRMWGLISHLVRESKIDIPPDAEKGIRMFCTALCACALSSPYDNHSFFEIVTVVDPMDSLGCDRSYIKFHETYYSKLQEKAPDCLKTLDDAITKWSRQYKWTIGESIQVKKSG